jgi:cation diffusion facilitator CzcD-associated flavoprotein CzcO
VELVTTPITRITETGIETADGRLRDFDILVCATGFHVFAKEAVPTFPVYGEDGVELTDKWSNRAFEIFKGVSINRFPNFFMVFGPHSVSSLSYIQMIETSVRHIVRVLTKARRAQATRVEVKAEAQAEDYRRVYARRHGAIYSAGHCLGSGGPPPGTASPPMRPGTCFSAWLDSKFFDLGSYDFRRA